jgi:hypothetical protein
MARFLPGGLWHRLLRRLYDVYHQWFFRHFFVPIWIGVPPVLFGMAYPNAVLATAAAAVWAALWMGIAKAIAYVVDSRELTLGWLTGMAQALDNVVAAKEDRMANHVQNASTLAPETFWLQIPQPKIQIEEIVRGLSVFFAYVQTSERKVPVHVFLARVRDQALAELVVRFPKERNFSLAPLKDDHSTLVTALRNKRIVVVESIVDELKKSASERRYVSLGGIDSGSLICYPITYGTPSEVHYLLCIRSNTERHFRQIREQIYIDTLERFALQIRLEHSLRLMQEVLSAPKNNLGTHQGDVRDQRTTWPDGNEGGRSAI